VHGWQPDPFGLHELRYFSQDRPTHLVKDGDVESYDDPPAGPAPTGATAPHPGEAPRAVELPVDTPGPSARDEDGAGSHWRLPLVASLIALLVSAAVGGGVLAYHHSHPDVGQRQARSGPKTASAGGTTPTVGAQTAPQSGTEQTDTAAGTGAGTSGGGGRGTRASGGGVSQVPASSASTTTPGASTPEAPLALALPLTAVLVVGSGVLVRRRSGRRPPGP
jgi:hypothetical protein